MAMAIAALRCEHGHEGELPTRGEKSYPGFFWDYQILGDSV
jgi:5-enolpyruvylshikimate-3-phosphate synthase